MKNYCFLLFFSLLLCRGMQAQKSNAIAFGLYLPVDVFAQSHIGGAGIDYSWSRHRFGKNVSPDKFLGFTANGGMNYYAGKKITVAGFDFRYGGYLNLYAMAGLLLNPIPNGNIALTAGPAFNIYEGNANTGISINLLSNYFVSENMAIGPGIFYKKNTDTDALWAVTIRVSYVF